MLTTLRGSKNSAEAEVVTVILHNNWQDLESNGQKEVHKNDLDDVTECHIIRSRQFVVFTYCEYSEHTMSLFVWPGETI